MERYATVADVQRLIWSGHLAISDSSEPNRAAVEDWLCDITQWIDTTLAWRYAVPVVDARDSELLRPVCAALAEARCWTALVGRNPGLGKPTLIGQGCGSNCGRRASEAELPSRRGTLSGESDEQDEKMAQGAWNDFEKLPLEAKRQVEDFIAFLLERSRSGETKSLKSRLPPIEDEAFIGMWKDRTDLEESSKWVRDLRKSEWGG